jgi:thiosulfate/3-mercaptopyruvate sulfurtransferase
MSHQTLIDAPELRRLIEDSQQTTAHLAATPNLAVIDCRVELSNPQAGRQAYLSGHIPGARYADLNEDLSGRITPESGRHPLPAPAIFAATLGRLGIAADAQVVAYDAANGAFAARLWWMLRAFGHREVAVLDGGYPAWIAAGGAVEAGEAMPPSRRVEQPPAIGAWPAVSSADVARLSHDPRRLLVDARAPERYAGSVEPIDAVAGHIPGAVNHPFSQNLDTDGRFLSCAELRRRWQARLAGRDAASVVAMCGSGVTACHNLLALEVAGLPGAKLYAGSWSEWIRDPRRPVARQA